MGYWKEESAVTCTSCRRVSETVDPTATGEATGQGYTYDPNDTGYIDPGETGYVDPGEDSSVQDPVEPPPPVDIPTPEPPVDDGGGAEE